MSSTHNLKPLSIALGTAFASALGVGIATAAENPFGQAEVSGGYLIADSHAGKAKVEGKCGEGKCGAGMNKDAKDKAMKEGLCGAMGKAQKEGDKAATPETPDNTPKSE